MTTTMVGAGAEALTATMIAEMAGAKGVKLASLALKDGKYQLAAFIDDFLPFLKQIGVRIKEVRGLATIDEVVNVARREPSPVIFAIKTTVRTAKGELKEILHSVIAMRPPGGGAVQFADYGGKLCD